MLRNEVRRERYRKDPTYRKGARKQSKEYYHKHVKRYVPLDRTIIKDGDKKFFSIGKLSLLINRKVQTIRAYHRRGIIPTPSHFDRRGWRLWNRDQALLLRRVFKIFDNKNDASVRTLRDVRKMLHAEWEE